MFIKNVFGKEEINQMAVVLGCEAGEAMVGKSQTSRPGLVGNTYPIKDQLKAAGAKFDGENKAWVFTSWAELEAAIKSINK
jgi:hypothetical protein